jgi:hypothetical protein
MTEGGKMLGVMLRDDIPSASILAVLRRSLGVTVVDFREYRAGDVLVEHVSHPRGFRTQLTVHIRPEVPLEDDVALARLLASELGMDVLATPPEARDNPYEMLLVKPDGSVFVVHEKLEDDFEGVEIDETHPAEPWIRPDPA